MLDNLFPASQNRTVKTPKAYALDNLQLRREINQDLLTRNKIIRYIGLHVCYWPQTPLRAADVFNSIRYSSIRVCGFYTNGLSGVVLLSDIRTDFYHTGRPTARWQNKQCLGLEEASLCSQLSFEQSGFCLHGRTVRRLIRRSWKCRNAVRIVFCCIVNSTGLLGWVQPPSAVELSTLYSSLLHELIHKMRRSFGDGLNTVW